MVPPLSIEFLLREYLINTIGKRTLLSSRALGNIGEAIARLELRRRNYRIITNNFNTAAGEIDIIASDGKDLVFIEVKTRTSYEFGSPSESIDNHKTRRIRKVAGFYLVRERPVEEYRDCRFDIITVMIKKDILNCVMGAITPDKVTQKDITGIADAIIDSCTIEHIEAAF